MNKLKSLILIFVMIFVVSLFLGWNYFPYWVSHGLSKKMGTDVSIGYINIAPFSLRVHDFVVENPSQFQLKKALDVSKIKVSSSLFSFMERKISIDKVILEDVYVGVEIESPVDTSGNWSYLLNNMKKNQVPSSESDRTLLIKNLRIEDLNLDLIVKSQGNKRKKIKTIKLMEFQNVSSDGDLPINELTKIITRELMKEIFKPSNLQYFLKDSIENPLQEGKDVVNKLKSLFSIAED